MADSSDLPFQPRVKRQKYTHNACDECKRRKAKCSGENPCARCASFAMQCVYKPSAVGDSEKGDVKSLHRKIDQLQDQISALLTHIRHATFAPGQATCPSCNHRVTYNSGATPSSASPSVSQQNPVPIPAYLGPTSSTFGLDALEQSQNRDPKTLHGPEVGSPPSTSSHHSAASPNRGQDDMPTIPKSDVLRLIDLYEETTGKVYPCVDIASVKNLAHALYDDQDAEGASRTVYGSSDFNVPFDRDLEILRTILAIGYAVEDRGHSGPGRRLMDRIEATMFNRFKVPEVDTKELLLLFLMSFYHFYLGDEVFAYRTTGLAVRGAIEMGLHRRATWARTSGIFPGQLARDWAIKLWWCIYVLDRRWSLGTGMPFGLQDSDIDAELPELDESTPYLRCLVAYGRLASKIWKSVTISDNAAKNPEGDDINYLDFLIHQWSDSIPTDLRLENAVIPPISTADRTKRMLQTVLHLYANQMRILIRKPYLMTKDSILRNLGTARMVVGVARDTIQHIHTLNSTTDIYARQRASFDYFLVSAIAVLFLAVSNAPDKFAREARDDFHRALNLVKDFTSRSLSARRLWQTIRRLRYLDTTRAGDVPPSVKRKRALTASLQSSGDNQQPQSNGPTYTKTNTNSTTYPTHHQTSLDPNTTTTNINPNHNPPSSTATMFREPLDPYTTNLTDNDNNNNDDDPFSIQNIWDADHNGLQLYTELNDMFEAYDWPYQHTPSESDLNTHPAIPPYQDGNTSSSTTTTRTPLSHHQPPPYQSPSSTNTTTATPYNMSNSTSDRALGGGRRADHRPLATATTANDDDPFNTNPANPQNSVDPELLEDVGSRLLMDLF